MRRLVGIFKGFKMPVEAMMHGPSNLVRSPPPPSAESWKRQTTFYEYDLLGLLPAAVRQKLKALRRALADSEGPFRGVMDEYHETRSKIYTLTARITHLERRENLRPDHPLVAAERHSLAQFQAESRELQALLDERKPSVSSLRLLIASAESYVRQLGGRKIELAPSLPEPKLARGESFFDAVEKARGKLAELRQDIEAAINAPIHSSAAKAAARAWVDNLAAAGGIDVSPLLDAGRPPILPQKNMPALKVFAGTSGLTEDYSAPNVEALFFRVHRDRILADLEHDIDIVADDASALSDEQRAKRISACKAAILDQERTEESLIVMAAESGLSVMRRPDADPRAILGLANSMPEPVQ